MFYMQRLTPEILIFYPIPPFPLQFLFKTRHNFLLDVFILSIDEYEKKPLLISIKITTTIQKKCLINTIFLFSDLHP